MTENVLQVTKRTENGVVQKPHGKIKELYKATELYVERQEKER
jgi:hypothetical protein